MVGNLWDEDVRVKGKARIHEDLRQSCESGFTKRLNRRDPTARVHVRRVPMGPSEVDKAKETRRETGLDWNSSRAGATTNDYAVASTLQSRRSRRRSMGTSPMLRDASCPFRKTSTVGMLWMPYRSAMAG